MSEPIRILQLVTIMDRGGTETMIMNYYRHIDRTKVQFDFMVHRKQRGAYDDEIEQLGGKIYRMMPLRPDKFGEYKKQIAEFFDEHPEYKIIHSNMSESGYFVFKEAAKRGIPVRICHAHSAPNMWDLKMFVRTYFKYNIRRYTTNMFACGQEAGIWLFGKKSKDSLTILNNAIDTRKYKYSSDIREKVLGEFNIKNELVIGHIGSFGLPKNHPFLIDIFSELVKINPRSKLMLVGDGEDRAEIESKVNRLGLSDKVIFTGVRSDVNELLQAMDVFVFPSLFEGLPVTIVEAQAAGLPCVISDKVPSQCIITDNLITVKSLSDSPEDWAKHILERAKEDRTDHSREVVESGYDIAENAKWLQEFYLSKAEE